MKPLNTSCAFILGAPTLFSISSASAGGCSSYTDKDAEIECLIDEKKCIDSIEKELQCEVEA